nr:hypothetical protein [Bacillus licheniformis]
MKTNQKEWLFNIIGVLVTAGFLFPVYWMIATAFKSDAELFKTPPLLWPETFRTAGFEAVFTSGVAGYFLNSLLISGVRRHRSHIGRSFRLRLGALSDQGQKNVHFTVSHHANAFACHRCFDSAVYRL